jgi:hypothetical protein
MTETNLHPWPHDLDKAPRLRIIAQATELNGKLLARLASVADDLDAGAHLAALGGLDGIEREIEIMRAFLLLLR